MSWFYAEITYTTQKAGGPYAKAILAYLTHRKNQKDGRCFPSVSTIARECEMYRKTVQRELRKLEAAGLIVIKAQKGTSHTYEFPFLGSVSQTPGGRPPDARVASTGRGGSVTRTPEYEVTETELEEESGRFSKEIELAIKQGDEYRARMAKGRP